MQSKISNAINVQQPSSSGKGIVYNIIVQQTKPARPSSAKERKSERARRGSFNVKEESDAAYLIQAPYARFAAIASTANNQSSPFLQVSRALIFKFESLSAQCMHHPSIMSAFSLHCSCIIYATKTRWLCTVHALSLHCKCTVSPFHFISSVSLSF